MNEAINIDIRENVFRDAIKKVWGAPAIISILVLFVLIYLSIFSQITETISIVLIGLAFVGMVLAFVLDLKRLKSEAASGTTAQRLIAFEIKDSIAAHLEGDKLKRGELIYGELSDRFQSAKGLTGLFRSLIVGIGKQIESVQARKRSERYMGALSQE